MLDVISILLAIYAGFLLVQVVDPVGNTQPKWAAHVFRVALGTGIGIGLTSVIFLLLDVLGAATPAAIFGVDIALIALLAGLWFRTRSGHSEGSSTEATTPAFRWTWLLALSFGIVLLASSIRVVQMAAALPVGSWDAWAMWNLRAKFLAGPAGAWRYATSPLLSTSHPDYPLLLPAFIARVWKAGGNMDAIVPVVTSLLFFVALVALLVSVVALLRGTASALLAGLVILSTASLLTWAPAQYADIPLAFYYLGAIALLFLDASPGGGRWPLLWAGLCASFAAWTKNEGIVFLTVIVIVFFVFNLRKRGGRPSLLHSAWLFAGAVPGVVLTLWFKFFLAPVADPLVKQGVSGLARLHDFNRYAEVAGGFFTNLWTLGWGVTNPLILLAILAILVRWKMEGGYRLPSLVATAALALVFLSYCGVLLITPYGLNWQVQTSFDRLILQVWPSALLIFFVQLRRIADSAPTSVAIKNAPARKQPARSSKAVPAGGKGK
jgi:hypothetical protein